MTTTPAPHAMDLTKVANATESTCPVVIVPHVPSSNTLRPIACETSSVLVDHTNLIRINKDRCTIHLNVSVNHFVVEQRTLELTICDNRTQSARRARTVVKCVNSVRPIYVSLLFKLPFVPNTNVRNHGKLIFKHDMQATC